MNDRLTRKEIKHDIREDQFRQGVAESYRLVSENLRLIVGVVLALVAVAAAIFGWRVWAERQEEAAGQQLAAAMEVYQAPVGDEQPLPGQETAQRFDDESARDVAARPLFEQVIEEYSRTGAAAVARVSLGRILLEQGETERARELWEEFLAGHDDNMLAATVTLALLALDRQAGKAEEVAVELQRQVDSREPVLPVDVALYQLGLTLEELDRPEEAQAAFQRLADEHPESPFARQAATKIRPAPQA